MTARIVLYAEVGSNSGGRARFVKSLVQGLSNIDNDGIEYLVVTHPRYGHWAEPFEGENITVLARQWRGTRERVKVAVKPLVGGLKSYVRPIANRLSKESDGGDPSVPNAGAFYESLDADVIHWPFRYWEHTDTPMVYNLGDIQDRHYPENFDADQRKWRDTFCQAGCETADAIITASEFVANDIVEQYGIVREKITVIHRGAPTQYDESSLSVREVCERFGLNPGFALYPGKKWPHKNHHRLLEALAELKEDGITVPLVCTGSQSPSDRFAELQQQTASYDLTNSVHWLGFVDTNELVSLYKAAGFLAFPTLFEGQGFPLVEAFDTGTAVTCSDIPPLREYGGSAPYYFNPDSVSAIADAVRNVYTDDQLRASLESKSRSMASRFDWETTACEYQRVYRSLL